MRKGVRSFRALALVGLFALFATACGGIETLTTQEALDRMTVASTKVYAADGSLIANLHGEIDRDIVPLQNIPKHVRDAVVAIEDRRFWSHRGVDMQALMRAVVENVQGRANGSDRLQGGSTISQQLVKNLYFSRPERTLRRKLAEARITLQFEESYSKPKILEMYLNTVYFGRGVYGVQAASQSYFRKDVQEMTLAEAAYLAGLIHEPGRYEWRDGDPPERVEARMGAARERRGTVLGIMHRLGAITEEEFAAAREAPLEISPPREQEWQFPYFVDAVLRELGVLRANGVGLNPRYDFLGSDYDDRAAVVYRGGLRIHTTVDPNAQRTAEEAIAETVPDVEKLSAALVAVDNDTGFVRALVGGRNYYPDGCDPEIPAAEQSHLCRLAKVNLALGGLGGGSGRQPGSAFKPVVLAAALANGVSLRSAFSSAPFEHSYLGGTWNVRNYEGSGGGVISLTDATVRSVNAAYARLEIEGIGDGDALKGSAEVASLSRKLGIPFASEQTLRETCGEAYGQTGACTPADAVPAIALGAKEVSPLELAGAYATFANDGVYMPPTTISKITDAEGRVLYEADPNGRRAISRDVSRGVTQVLQEVIRRGTGTRARIGRPAAGKTGTSQMWRDAWFAGYVPQLTAVAWVGNPIPVQESDGSWGVESMTPANGYPQRIVGGSYPAMIWRAFMEPTLKDVPPEDFRDPSDRFLRGQYGTTDSDEVDRISSDQSAVPPVESEPGADGSSGGEAVTQPESQSGTVPGVVGMSPANARITLSRAGYGASQVSACPPGGSSGMYVWRQSPGGGSSAPRGMTVTIWVSKAVC